MNRREFPKNVRFAAWERSAGQCEKCTAKLFPGNVEYDHVNPDALGGEPTLDNCLVVCRACHAKKTAKEDMPRIAKMRRVQITQAGIVKPRTIRAWRKFDGTIVRAGRDR